MVTAQGCLATGNKDRAIRCGADRDYRLNSFLFEKIVQVRV
jgi:hypothetical protein